MFFYVWGRWPGFERLETASVAQLVELLICNQWVGGSNPSAGSRERPDTIERPLSAGHSAGARCKPFVNEVVAVGFPSG